MRPSEPDLALLRGLVEIPSVSRREGDAVEWLVARMADRGFRANVDDAGNAVGEIGDGPMHVVLLGHIDTVPGEIPVRIEGDDLVGRGAVDAKGPLTAFVAAATEPIAGVRVTVVGAVEEESPTSRGARYRATLPAPSWCVIGEPSGWDAVTVGYKGRLTLEVALSREARHGASPGPTMAVNGADGVCTNAHQFARPAQGLLSSIVLAIELSTCPGFDGFEGHARHSSTISRRLFPLPLFSEPAMRTRPTSRVLATWVPPSAC